MFGKPLFDLTLQDIDDLVTKRKERENNHLEYKALLGNADRDKKEFLKDVTGLANADGGYLIIGVEEKDGLPNMVCGAPKEIGGQKVDEWINNVLISNVAERLRYDIKVIQHTADTVVIVLHLNESARKPHMVTFQGKNTYFVRHNTSVNPATQSEVREMFEYVRKNKDDFEQFLSQRNLLDDKVPAFARNENTSKLHSELVSHGATKEKSFALYSFIPRYLQDDKVKTASQDFLNWLNQHMQGFQPAPHVPLLETHYKQVNLYGTVYPKIPSNSEPDLWSDYFEILNNGFFESGVSWEIFSGYLSHDNQNAPRKPFLNLTYAVGYAWLLFNFAREFYRSIGYDDEVLFQLSMVNVKDYVLASFGKQNDRMKWVEPWDWMYPDNPPLCRHTLFKISERFLAGELSDGQTKAMAIQVAEKLSRAFGVSQVKCFDESGSFNIETFNHFRR